MYTEDDFLNAAKQGDIEVVKVREGDAGTIRLSLESKESRLRAQQLLHQIGFTTRLRN